MSFTQLMNLLSLRHLCKGKLRHSKPGWLTSGYMRILGELEISLKSQGSSLTTLSLPPTAFWDKVVQHCMIPNELVRLHNTYHAHTYGGAFGWNSKLGLSEVTPVSDTLVFTKQGQEVGNLNLSPPPEDRTFAFPQLPISIIVAVINKKTAGKFTSPSLASRLKRAWMEHLISGAYRELKQILLIKYFCSIGMIMLLLR